MVRRVGFQGSNEAVAGELGADEDEREEMCRVSGEQARGGRAVPNQEPGARARELSGLCARLTIVLLDEAVAGEAVPSGGLATREIVWWRRSAGPPTAGGRMSPDVDVVRIVERARAGSPEAFERLADEFVPRLYRLLLLRLRSEEDARDALQETLCAAWIGLPRLRDPRKIAAWLAGIAINKARTTARRRNPLPFADLDAVEIADAADSSLLLDLRVALEELPGELRDVLLMRYVLGLSEREAAHAAGVRLGTVKSRTARARQALIRALDERDRSHDRGHLTGGK